MRERVLDTSVVGRWFEPSPDPASAAYRHEFEAGQLVVTIPPLLFLELLNVAGRQWRWSEAQLLGLVDQAQEFGFEVAEPALERVALWTARGLTAYDATYVALAEERAIPLITDDRQILAIASGIARPVASA